jgi:hypothetical protein
MQKSLAFMLVLAASSTAALAQSPDPATNQSQPAPIVRANQNPNVPHAPDPDTYARNYGAAGAGMRTANQITNSQPISGVLVRVPSGTTVQTVSSSANGTELRLDHGRANISVHHPDSKVEILVDLPGGQTSLLKDGLYTFNADTNTVRVLKGEAAAYPGVTSASATGANAGSKPIKIKEAHQLNFAGTQKGVRSVEVNNPRELTADLLPSGDGYPRGGGYPGRAYGYGPYGDGYGYGYPYPYYPYGYYGYPYGYGLGFGFGYYGGFGGYRGGFGGFRGRR